MTLWLTLLVGTALCGFAMMRWGALDRAGQMLTAAALVGGIAAYVAQGQPGLPGASIAPTTVLDDPDFGKEISVQGAAMADRFGPAGQWLMLADRLARRGKTELAVRAVDQGLKQYPGNIDLMVARANVLVAHGGGFMNPAAALAFDEAARAAPGHPAPSFFAGLALAQSGDLAGAETVWGGLLARSPADAPWRADLAARLVELKAARAGPVQSIP